ncbi:hypothetical protein WS90_17030 [Burkholderia cepacia]|uniref:Uncharacterized protein n=1 Tax=Burkholderia cepacia TaxID=292 RepID=A0A124SNI1_BURCE|nr:hypothetical protein WS90_17030 [Burkholderia cepacia]
MRFLEIADAALLRARECAGLVAEQLALRKLIAPKSTAMNAPVRPLTWWIWRATSSLPVPVSPRISAGGTVDDTGIRPRV